VTVIHAGHNSCFCQLSLIMHLAFFYMGDTVLRHCVSCRRAGLHRPFEIKQIWWFEILEFPTHSYSVISQQNGVFDLTATAASELASKTSGRSMSKLLTERSGRRIFKVICGRGIFPCQYILHNHGYSANFNMSLFSVTTRIKYIGKWVCTSNTTIFI